MNAQVLTINTSASAASAVTVWPACSPSPSITSESTRFLGQPREIMPIFIQASDYTLQTTDYGLRVQPIQHSRIGDGLAHVFESADPRDDALDAHPETA